jgi:hypothetical protein
MWRLFNRQGRDADLEEELQAHLEIETRQLMERGLPRDQAEMEARRLFGRQFGSRALVMEASREVSGHGGFARLWQDIRYAARILRRGPAFTAAAVLSLALGIGATTAVFSIADTVFLRPLPYADSGQLVWVAIRFLGLEFVPSPDYVAWRRDNRVFQHLAATQASFSTTMLLGGSDPAEVHAGRVSANFLDTFAVAPALGRTFRADEELPNGPKAVLLTYQFWRDRFHGRREVLGSVITLDGQPSPMSWPTCAACQATKPPLSRSARRLLEAPSGSHSRGPTGRCLKHFIVAMASACVVPTRTISKPREPGWCKGVSLPPTISITPALSP